MKKRGSHAAHGSNEPPQSGALAGAGAAASAPAPIDLTEPFPLEGVHVPRFVQDLPGCVFQGDLAQHDNHDERGRPYRTFHLVGPHRILQASPNGTSLFALEALHSTPPTIMTLRFRGGKVHEVSCGTVNTDLNHPHAERDGDSVYGNGIVLTINPDNGTCEHYARGAVKWTNERGTVSPSIVRGEGCPSFERLQLMPTPHPVTTRYGTAHCMMTREYDGTSVTDVFSDPTYFAEPFYSAEDQQADLRRELEFQTRVFDVQIANAVRCLHATQFQMRSLAESANMAQSCFVHRVVAPDFVHRVVGHVGQTFRQNPMSSVMDQLTRDQLAQRSSTVQMLKTNPARLLMRKWVTNPEIQAHLWCRHEKHMGCHCKHKKPPCCEKGAFFNLAHEFEYPVRTTRVAEQQHLRSNLVFENFAKNRSLMDELASVQFPQSAGEAELGDVMHDPNLMAALTDLANSMGGHEAARDGADASDEDDAMDKDDVRDGASGGFRKRNSKKPKSRSKTKKSKTMRKRKTRRSH
jgi:hypothetical protein